MVAEPLRRNWRESSLDFRPWPDSCISKGLESSISASRTIIFRLHFCAETDVLAISYAAISLEDEHIPGYLRWTNIYVQRSQRRDHACRSEYVAHLTGAISLRSVVAELFSLLSKGLRVKYKTRALCTLKGQVSTVQSFQHHDFYIL